MRTLPLDLGRLCAAAFLATSSTAAWAGCPPGYTETSHRVEGTGDNQVDIWTCRWAGARAAKTALQQLQNMGKGFVDTTTGFDGGQGMSSAVATAPAGGPVKINMGVVTADDLRSFGGDKGYSEASASLDYARGELKKAQDKMSELRQQQIKAASSLEKQKIQIAISDASIALNKAKGEEKIATNNLVKEVIRLKPEVITKTSPKTTKK